jgi:CTP synthase
MPILTIIQRPYLGFVAASAGCLADVINQKPVEPFKTVTLLNGTTHH